MSSISKQFNSYTYSTNVIPSLSATIIWLIPTYANQLLYKSQTKINISYLEKGS